MTVSFLALLSHSHISVSGSKVLVVMVLVNGFYMTVLRTQAKNLKLAMARYITSMSCSSSDSTSSDDDADVRERRVDVRQYIELREK
jgi:hypothetical protein